MSDVVREAFKREWTPAAAARDGGNLNEAHRRLDRAHILSQCFTMLHVRSQVGMMRLGLHRQDMHEVTAKCSPLRAVVTALPMWAGTRCTRARPCP